MWESASSQSSAEFGRSNWRPHAMTLLIGFLLLLAGNLFKGF